jgi:hypothetical protein
MRRSVGDGLAIVPLVVCFGERVEKGRYSQ